MRLPAEENRHPPRSGRSSGQRPNRQLVATRRHGTATINSILRLSLTLTGSPRFMKYAAATSGHQFPLVRFPASRATLEFTTKFIVMSAVALARLPRLTPSAIFMASLALKSPGNGGASLVVRFMIERKLLHTSTRGSVAPRRTSNRRFIGDCIHPSLLRRGIRLRQRRQVARRAKRGALRSKVARGRATEPPDSHSLPSTRSTCSTRPTLCAPRALRALGAGLARTVACGTPPA